MTTVRYARAALDDLLRISTFLATHTEQDSRGIDVITRSIEVLVLSPEVGRPVEGLRRELVLGRGARGYVALYRFDSDEDEVLVLRVRARREGSYPD